MNHSDRTIIFDEFEDSLISWGSTKDCENQQETMILQDSLDSCDFPDENLNKSIIPNENENQPVDDEKKEIKEKNLPNSNDLLSLETPSKTEQSIQSLINLDDFSGNPILECSPPIKENSNLIEIKLSNCDSVLKEISNDSNESSNVSFSKKSEYATQPLLLLDQTENNHTANINKVIPTQILVDDRMLFDISENSFHAAPNILDQKTIPTSNNNGSINLLDISLSELVKNNDNEAIRNNVITNDKEMYNIDSQNILLDLNSNKNDQVNKIFSNFDERTEPLLGNSSNLIPLEKMKINNGDFSTNENLDCNKTKDQNWKINYSISKENSLIDLNSTSYDLILLTNSQCNDDFESIHRTDQQIIDENKSDAIKQFDKYTKRFNASPVKEFIERNQKENNIIVEEIIDNKIKNKISNVTNNIPISIRSPLIALDEFNIQMENKKKEERLKETTAIGFPISNSLKHSKLRPPTKFTSSKIQTKNDSSNKKKKLQTSVSKFSTDNARTIPTMSGIPLLTNRHTGNSNRVGLPKLNLRSPTKKSDINSLKLIKLNNGSKLPTLKKNIHNKF